MGERAEPNLEGGPISWSYRLPDDGHFCVDFTCRAGLGISDPFRKPQRRRCYVRLEGWSLLTFAAPRFLSMDSSLISARRRADSRLGNNKHLCARSGITLVNSSSGVLEWARGAYCVPKTISYKVYRCTRIIVPYERIHG